MTYKKFYSLHYSLMLLVIAILPTSVVNSEEKTTEINEFTKKLLVTFTTQSSSVPNVSDPQWAKNPIDAFIFSKLKDNGLEPNPSASKEELARRAYLNITGIAPTPEQVSSFVLDKSPDAWEKLVNKLLDTPQYGEKWARHWLDVVRYAESNGFEKRF